MKQPAFSAVYHEDGTWKGGSVLPARDMFTSCVPPLHAWLLARGERAVGKTCVCGEYTGAECPTCHQHWKIIPAVLLVGAGAEEEGR